MLRPLASGGPPGWMGGGRKHARKGPGSGMMHFPVPVRRASLAAGRRGAQAPAASAGWRSGRTSRTQVPTNHAAQPEEDLVRLYLNDIGKHALLTKDDEARLAHAIEAGREARGELSSGKTFTVARKRELRRVVKDGDEAAETFVKANLRLVVSIAKKYQAAELPLLDLVQEGNLGLMHAVEKFDWRKGVKFSTSATWWSRQAITRGIANTGRSVRLPVHAGDLLTRLTKARGRLEGQLGRRPTGGEVVAALELEE